MFWPFGVLPWASRIFFGVILTSLSLLSGWITIRVAVNPIAKVRKRALTGGKVFPFTIEQMALIKQANQHVARQDFREAENTYDEVMALMTVRNSDGFTQLLLGRISAQLQQKEIDRAEKACLDFVAQPLNREHKLKVLDGFALAILYQLSSPWLDRAEKAVRLALEIAPGTLTLKGTLGGILVERGEFKEAESLLRECLERSPAYHDQGISSFYLGLIRLQEGRVDEGKRLIKNGTTLYPEAWLLAKANAKLGEPLGALLRSGRV